MIETFNDGKCDDNSTAVSIQKCCPLGQFYDANLNLCRLAGMDGVEHLQLIRDELRMLSDVLANADLVGYNYEMVHCNKMNYFSCGKLNPQEKPFTSSFPSFRCFDQMPDDGLLFCTCFTIAECMLNTCVRSCCMGDRMIVDGPK